MTNDEKYPRWLNGHGCIFGQNLAAKFETWRKDLKEELKEDYKCRMDKLDKKLDRLTWAAVSVAITLMTASLTLWITYFTN
jgi:hypothetical protein